MNTEIFNVVVVVMSSGSTAQLQEIDSWTVRMSGISRAHREPCSVHRSPRVRTTTLELPTVEVMTC